MRIIVTGGAGFIGTNLIKELIKNEHHQVVSIDNYNTGTKLNEQSGCIYYNADISEVKAYNDFLEDADLIFHIGARARIQPSFKDPQASFEANVLGTQNILEYARRKNIPVVYAGSSSAHGDLHANPYTFTKWQGEQICNLYYKVFNQRVAICRFYNVYGPHQATEGDYCNVLGIFERQWKNNQTLTVTGDGEQRRDFTHVQDIVQGLIRCGYKLCEDLPAEVSGETFELGRGVNYSINELVDAFGEMDVEYLPAYPGEMRETLNVDTKAQEILGWKPEHDIIDYIKKTFRRKK